MDDETTEELTVQCDNCAESVPEDESRTINDATYCDSCADEFGMCEDCETQVPQDDLVLVNSMDTYRWRNTEKHVCENCSDRNYYECDSCAERHDNLTTVLDGSEVCEGCRENMNYCEDCDGYYGDCDGDEHAHGGCECEVPSGLIFKIKNGDSWLQNDTRISLDLAGGMISDVGMSLIENLVRNEGRRIAQDVDPSLQPYSDEWYAARQSRSTVLDQWYEMSYNIQNGVGTEWQTNRGNFTKRLSRFAHQQGIKLSADVLTSVGNVAREQSQGSSVNLETTRNLNLSAGEFYHEDSCWWQSYSDSRCALKSNGGIGLRTFQRATGGYVTGRAWAMPLRSKTIEVRPLTQWVNDPTDRIYGGRMVESEGPARLVSTFVATFDTETPDAWMIFNGYGDLGGYAAARILSQMNGLTYRKCDFEGAPMYVNSGGYIVATEEAATLIAKEGLSLDLEEHSDLHEREQINFTLAA